MASRREAALGLGEPGEARPIANDDPDTANRLFQDLLVWAGKILKPGGALASCCGGGGPDPQFARWALWIDGSPDLRFKQMVVWDKGPMGLGWHYRRSYETVLVATRKGALGRWYDDSGRIENIIRPGDWGVRKIIPDKSQHPTEKPWQLGPFSFACIPRRAIPSLTL